ncbi:MAG: DUF3289 family protein [Mariniblastus sp.]
MSKSYSFGGYRVLVESDGAIKVKSGNTLSGYSMAIHRDTNHISSFGRMSPSGQITPIYNPNQLRAGETIHHVPTYQQQLKNNGPKPFPKNFGISRANPKLIIKSNRDRGFNYDGSPAADLMFGDFNEAQIRNLGKMFKMDDLMFDLDSGNEQILWDKFQGMSTDIFAVGDLETNIIAMIAHFRGNTGSDYSNPILTQAARNHELSQKFEGEVRQSMLSAIQKYKGDPSQIQAGDVTRKTGIRFSSKTDTFAGGLTIAVNDVWAWKVEIVDYSLDGADFKGTYRVTLFDHFGLDQPDVDKKYGYLAGFRAWFILQHYDRFAYRPFVSVMTWESRFQGQVLLPGTKGDHHPMSTR